MIPILNLVSIMTKQRRLLHEILFTPPSHMTAEEVYQEAKKVCPGISLGTVYRNLKLMTEEGEIKRIPIVDGPDRYDRTVAPHDHLLCKVCQKILDLPPLDLKTELFEKIGVEIDSYELTIWYVCPACRNSGRE